VRLEVLGKVISLAIQLKCMPLLNDAALWMVRHLQQKSPTDHMIKIAEQLVSDYCSFAADDLYSLQEVVKDSPTFAAVLFSLIFENYELGRSPSFPFFKVIVEWLSNGQKSMCKNLKSCGESGKNLTYMKFFAHNFARFLCLDVTRALDLTLTREQRSLLVRMHLQALQFIILCSKSNVEPAKILPARVINCCLAAISKFLQENSHRKDIIDESIDKLTQLVQVCYCCNFLFGVTKNDIDPSLISKFPDYTLLQYVFDHCF